MQCYLVARHYICELCNAMLFRQASYIELYHAVFLYFSLLLSTMFVYSTALPVHQPFELVMEKSGVKTRSSEQTMLYDEAHVLLVTDSSSEEDSETDDQSYPPRGACPNLAGLCCSYRAYGILHCYVICLV